MADAKFNLNDYVQVNERIEAFYKKYPEGSIQTEMILNQDGTVIFKAFAYRNSEDTKPTTGHAMEKEGSTYINKTSHIENCETSAVGRALAMLGFEIKKSVASREEVQNARSQQEQQEKPKGKLITPEQIEALKEKATEKKVGIDYILKVKKKNTLEELTADDYTNAMTWLEKK